jgi:hypothetical protein
VLALPKLGHGSSEGGNYEGLIFKIPSKALKESLKERISFNKRLLL